MGERPRLENNMSYSFRRKFDDEDIHCRTCHFTRDIIVRCTVWFVWTVVLSAVIILLVCGDHIEHSLISKFKKQTNKSNEGKEEWDNKQKQLRKWVGLKGGIRDGGSSHVFECVFVALTLPPCWYASHDMKKSLRAITLIFNSVMRTGYFPAHWKVSQIITILKPGKPADEVTSYRPISLLPILSKLSEKLFLTRLQPLLHEQRTIPDHQFGFRQKHATIEQVHCVTNAITEVLESHKYCTAAFLDISQAFDKVWHEGLICKLRPLFPATIHKLLRSYLEHWYFLIKYREAYRPLHPILSGVPQGSVLGPLHYLLYTADQHTAADSTSATFAGDTVVLTAHENPAIATHRLQLHLHEVQLWLKNGVWKPMKQNRSKLPLL